MRHDEKGFSLVELIIVIAIMAVLIGTVAPMFVKYVERAQKARDMRTAGLIAKAYETAITNSPDAYALFDEWCGPSHANLHTTVTVNVDGKMESYGVTLIVASEDTTWTGKQKEYQSGFYELMDEELGLKKGTKNWSMVPRYKVKKSGPHSSGESHRSYVEVDRWRIVKRLDNGQIEVWTADGSKYGGWPQFRVWPEPDDVYTSK